jgi:hypothetical protein
MHKVFHFVFVAVLLAACSNNEEADVFGTGQGGENSRAQRQVFERFNKERRIVVPSRIGHVDGPVDYAATEDERENAPADGRPPVVGPHNPKWLRCDVYDAPVPNEYAVHSIERGAVWVTYQPGLPPEQVRQLAALSGTAGTGSTYRPGLTREQLRDLAALSRTTTREFVLVSPYEGIPAPIVVATWGVWMPIESASDPVLSLFMEAYAGMGPGGRPIGCRTDGLTPQQAAQDLATVGAP